MRATLRSRSSSPKKALTLGLSLSSMASKNRSSREPARICPRSSAVKPNSGLARHPSSGISCLGLETVCKRLCRVAISGLARISTPASVRQGMPCFSSACWNAAAWELGERIRSTMSPAVTGRSPLSPRIGVPLSSIWRMRFATKAASPALLSWAPVRTHSSAAGSGSFSRGTPSCRASAGP